MPRVLVIEDNQMKFQSTANYIREVLPNVEIVHEKYAKGGVNRLIEEEFDFVVVDMYMPINSDGRIDREGGFYVLGYMERKGIDVKAIVNSSEATVKQQIIDKGYDTSFIHYSSMYDLTNDFKLFFGV